MADSVKPAETRPGVAAKVPPPSQPAKSQPKPVPPGKLPPEMRGSFMRAAEPLFMILMIISLLLHLVLVLIFSHMDIEPEAVKVEKAPEVEIATPDIFPEDVTVAEPAQGAGEEGKKKGGGGGGKKGKGPGVESMGLLGILTRSGTGGRADTMGMGLDMSASVGPGGGVRVGRAGEGGGGPRGGGGGGGGGALGIDGLGGYGQGGTVDTGAKKVFKVKSPIQENPEVKGKLDPATIRATFGKYLKQIEGCYQQALNTDENLQGKIVVQFTIGEDGSVISVNIASSSIANEELKSCIQRRVQRMNFPKPEQGTVQVTYPFIFTAVK